MLDEYEIRFGSIARLYGKHAAVNLRNAHVAVVGLGGVGSWAAEALARTGIGALTLIDLDDICRSNVNRQLHALDGAFGQLKVEAMQARVRAIHPGCAVHAVQAFFTRTNAAHLLATPFHFVLDAIDSPSKKCLLIALCRERGLRIVTTGASAGRRNPTLVRVADLALTSHDRLLQEVRKKLRVRHGFPRNEHPFQVEAVYSMEPPVFPGAEGSVCDRREPGHDGRLDCQSGMGTACFVTAAFGFVAAAHIVQTLASQASARVHPA